MSKYDAMKAFRKLIRICVFVLFLLGCTSAAQNGTPTIKENETTTSQPSLQLTLTNTVANIEERCPRVVKQKPSNLTGHLVLGKSESVVAIVVAQTSKEKILGDISQIFVSPDREKMAYVDADMSTEIVANKDGQRELSIPDPDSRLTLVGWLDNSHLLFDRRNNEFNGPLVPATLIVFDVQNGGARISL